MMQLNCDLPQEMQEWKKELREVLAALQVDRFELAVAQRVANAESEVPLEFMDFRDYLARIVQSLTAQTAKLERLYMQLPDPLQDN
ncbi:MAG: hypothetical protein IJA78_04585 [Clostridia bacterium]|nr:hypothetical protein [Clostridia bacterium]